VTLAEIRALLHTSARVRMPRFTEQMTSRERVEALEDYLNLTAVTRGELEEARLYAQGALHDLSAEWDTIVGWEMHLRHHRANVALHEINAAKREVRPDLHAGITEAKWLVARLSEQINRLAKLGDDEVASRLYTLIVGG
jgi:hypothetical protein